MTLPQSTKKRSRRSRTILRTQFTGLTEETIAKVPDQLRNPLKYQFRSVVFVAEHAQAQIRGFALLLAPRA